MSDAARSYNPGDFRREYIADEEGLRRAAAELESADALGVDLEMAQRVERRPGGYQQWIHVLALIQISSSDLSVVVDPLRSGDLSPLRPLMAGGTRKVFLGGGQDASLLEKAGIPARHIVDVGEVALAIFGRREDGMAALAHRIFGISLDKSVRRADWLARPLNPTLLAYAHRDAELTLLIYRWFADHYPEVVASHERLELDPGVPPGTPTWLEEAMTRPVQDTLAIVMGNGLRPEEDAEVLSRAVGQLLATATAPRQINKILRIAGELQLKPLTSAVLPLADSPSGLVRASAARAIGALTEPELGLPILERMEQDPVEDVRKAATAARREMQSPPAEEPPEPEEEETSTLDEGARSALQELLRQMESWGG